MRYLGETLTLRFISPFDLMMLSTNPSSRPRIGVDALIGLLLPLPIFVEPTSPILLAVSGAYAPEHALPISIFVFPIAMLVVLVRTSWRIEWNFFWSIALPCSLFVLWALILGVISSVHSATSLAYALQWILPFSWLLYFCTIDCRQKLLDFFQGFAAGSALAVTYILAGGILELVLYGALLDAGRMSQNLVIPGQGQLYVYTPTAIAYAVLLTNWAVRADVIRIAPYLRYLLNTGALAALIFMAAREGLLVFVLGIAALYALGSARRTLLVGALAASCVVALFAVLSNLTSKGIPITVRILAKVAALGEEGRALGSRDQMIGQYLSVIRDSPIFGSAMLPPETIYRTLGVTAPSAHNYYVDVFAWTGLVGGILIAMAVVYGLAASILAVLQSYRRPLREMRDRWVVAGSASCLILFFVVSNNINVPLRQPLTGPLAALMMYLVMRYREVIKGPSVYG